MADLNVMQTSVLRAEIKRRYGKDINHKIKKVVFLLPNNNRVIFTAEDSFEAEKEEEHRTVFRLFIYENSPTEEPGVMEFKTLEAAMTAFCIQQKNNHARLCLMEDDKPLQNWWRA